MLNPVKAAIVLSSNVPDEFLRDLVVRNITVVLVGREPTTYSVNAVLVDRSLAGMCLAREMMLAGHRRFIVVEQRGQTALVEAVRKAATRYASDATVDSVFAADAMAAVEQQNATAILCDTRKTAVQVRELLSRRNIAVPEQVSVAAIGSGWGDYPCSGYFVHSQQKAETAIQLIRDTQVKRPTTIWLTGTFADCGTIAGCGSMMVHHTEQPAEQMPQFKGAPI